MSGDYWLGQSESAKYWLSALNEFKPGRERCADFRRGWADRLPRSHQGCIPSRNSALPCPPGPEFVGADGLEGPWRSQAIRLRSIYTAPTEEAGLMALAQFEVGLGAEVSPGRCPGSVIGTELATFSIIPEAVRRLIYTTNPIESLNSRVRKTVKGKSVFPRLIALFKALHLAVAEAEKRWTMKTRTVEIMAQLSIFFQDRDSGLSLLNHQPGRLHSFRDTPENSYSSFLTRNLELSHTK